MSDRGEQRFVRLPGFAAGLYDKLTHLEAIQRQHRQIAQDLIARIEAGRLLDIGAGPGRLLSLIHCLNPHIELYGLDISAAMVELAGQNLAGIPVDLRRDNIRHTGYEDNFFDLVTCTGSFYLWDEPEACLKEVYRILQAGKAAYCYESYQDFDNHALKEAMAANLRDESLFRRLVSPHFLKRQLRMAYRMTDIAAIIERTAFDKNYSLEKLALGGLPAWVRIELRKPA